MSVEEATGPLRQSRSYVALVALADASDGRLPHEAVAPKM